MTTYRDNPALSQSTLKLLTTDPQSFFNALNRAKERKQHFNLGTAVDVYTLESLEALMERVKILKEPVTGSTYRVCEILIEQGLDAIEENILAIREELGLYPTWKDATFLNKFYSEAVWYYDELVTEDENTIWLIPQDLENALAIGNSLMNNPKTKFAFNTSDEEASFHHVDIYFRHLGVDCKAELDKVILNFRNKTIQFFDVKTTSKPTRWFVSSVKDFRYDIQAACYTLALLYLVKGEAVCPKMAKIDLSDFIVLQPIFLVETTDPSKIGVCPMPYKASTEMLRAGRYGVYPDKRFTVTGPGDRILFDSIPLIPGYDTLIEDYKWFQTRTDETDKGYTRIELEQMDSTGAIILNPW